jgi:hypothetical protein
MPIVYGKIRVLNMTKSAKTRRKFGRTVRGNPRVLVTSRLSLAQSSSEKENPPSLTNFFYLLKIKLDEMVLLKHSIHGVHYEYVGMSFVFSRSTKKIIGIQRQARRAVFIAVRLFDTVKKSNKIEPSENFHGVTGMFFQVVSLGSAR